MQRKINTKELIQKIEKLTKSRIAGQEVVPLDSFRSAKKKMESKTILAIEDDESMRNVYVKVFSSEGFEMKLAEDAPSLSKVLDDKAIDLILLDIGLPWINGFELAQMLKEHVELRKIPLIFVSATQSEDDIRKAFAIGADDFIRKPFDIEKLKKSVNTLLRLSER